jgi:hypothetical protein
MSRKIGLIVSMLVFVVGCDEMGSRTPIVRTQADDDVTAAAVVHYYVDADGAVMELWVDSTCTPDSINSAVWQEVSLDSLHALGLYSPAENVAQAVEDGTAGPIGETFSGNYRSYVTCRYIEERWQIILGSETWRGGFTPGWCYVYGESRQQTNLYFSASRRQIGYKAYVQAHPKFETQTYWYDQEGLHAFTQSTYPRYPSLPATGYYP